ncbi:MAG: dihydroorotase [Gemmatimonadota bacterium]
MSARPILIRGGRVVDPGQKLDRVLDLLLAEGNVVETGAKLAAPDDAEVIEADGLVVCPGLIDVHVHLREPGAERKETIASGARAAAAGGFTSICAMPNTDPVIDSPATVGFVAAAGARAQACRVYPVGAISIGQKGERLSEIGELVDAGAVAITDDGNPVMDSGLMRLALEYAQAFDIPVADHPEDLTLSRNGVMNEGVVSSRLGLKGKPNASEDVHIVRDLMLAEHTGGRIHLQHVSTAGGVDAIRRAKERGVRVTAEATPHHLVLTDEACEGYRTDAKMNPPLRTRADREAVREGLRDGTLDTLATDHAPHHYDEKEQAFDDAPFGIVGLETSLALVLTHMVGGGVIDLSTMIERMSCAPARAFNLPGGTLAPKSVADVTLFDPEAEWTVDPKAFVSKSGNTPFAGHTLRGMPRVTIVGGRVVWRSED